MNHATFLVDRGNDRAPKNAVNVPRILDDTVEPIERTSRRLPALHGQRIGFEYFDAIRLLMLGALVGFGLRHLIARGLF